MKRLLLVVCFIAVLVISAHAQFSLGVRGALTSSTIEVDKVTANGYTVESANNAKVGIQLGLISRLQIVHFFIQPELLLSTSGGNIRVTDISTGSSDLKKQTFTKIDIPVLVGMKYGPIRFGIGPVATMVVNSKSELSDISGWDDKYKSATFGYQAGVGLDLWKLSLDVKYEGNLSKMGDGITIAGQKQSFDSRVNQWIFGVALFF